MQLFFRRVGRGEIKVYSSVTLCLTLQEIKMNIEPVEQSTFPEKITRKEGFSGAENRMNECVGHLACCHAPSRAALIAAS